MSDGSLVFGGDTGYQIAPPDLRIKISSNDSISEPAVIRTI